ncbi:MAG: protein kinase [Planctomycetes bacterium]|nr:protein kinase [Planctomycetota bacterium]
MGMAADQFGKALVASGLLTIDEVQALWQSLPTDARPKDGEQLAKLLVERGKLTEFQAKQTLAGRAAALVMNQYVLLEKIGAGGMGQVYKAQHKRLKRLTAIKVLPASLVKNAEAIKRFQREVESAARLSHANIVQAYDADECNGVHFLAMEYVEGRDLSTLVRERGALPVSDVVNYILQAARGLAYAHAEGMVHRDIKPANLLLDKKGVVKILDMGLARFEDGGQQQELTQSGMVMGTVEYMAPEQAKNTRGADARSDVYSLGCSLYRIMIGENVYDAESTIAKIIAHMQAPIPSLRTKRAEVPAEVDRIYQRMLAKRPEDRYQNAGELLVDLEAWQKGSSGGGSDSIFDDASPQLNEFLSNIGSATSGIGRSSSGIMRAASASGISKTAITPSKGTETGPISKALSGTERLPVATMLDEASGRSAVVAATEMTGEAEPGPAQSKKLMMIGGGVIAAMLVVSVGAWALLSKSSPKTEVAAHTAKPAPAVKPAVPEKKAEPSAATPAPADEGIAVPTAANPARDRAIAQFLLEQGISVTIEPGTIGAAQTLSGNATLPKHDFVVVRAGFPSNKTPDEEALAKLPELRQLKSLNVYGAKLTDAMVKSWDKLPQLESLDITNNQLTGTVLLTLRNQRSLRFLGMYQNQIPPRAGASFAASQFSLGTLKADFDEPAVIAFKPPPDLRSIELYGLATTDAALKRIGTWSKIDDLRIPNGKVTEAGFKELAQLKDLKKLYLEITDISDPWLVHLQQLPKLEWLQVNNTLITDAGLEHLAKIRTLRFLRGARSAITAAGVAKLQTALPQCKIDWKPVK